VNSASKFFRPFLLKMYTFRESTISLAPFVVVVSSLFVPAGAETGLQ